MIGMIGTAVFGGGYYLNLGDGNVRSCKKVFVGTESNPEAYALEFTFQDGPAVRISDVDMAGVAKFLFDRVLPGASPALTFVDMFRQAFDIYVQSQKP